MIQVEMVHFSKTVRLFSLYLSDLYRFSNLLSDEGIEIQAAGWLRDGAPLFSIVSPVVFFNR
ncbi:hypothetical protein RYX53_16070, partial [Alkalibacillus haloalkaliphilus]